MAYNNGFSIGYNPYQQYQQMMPQSQPQQQSNPITWVQGEAGAKSYLVAPNSTAALWDSESQTIYLKSADASGMPSMKILDYKVRDVDASRDAHKSLLDSNKYVTKEELDAFRESVEKRLKEALNGGSKNEQPNL